MAELTREELKKKFRNGSLAREENFVDLIDSFVNKVSDRELKESNYNGAHENKNLPTSFTGKVGINTTSPVNDLDVNGSIGMKMRMGMFWDAKINPRQIIADGNWHSVITNLKQMIAFEIISAVQCPEGKYAMYYSVAINAFGKTRKIRPLQRSHSSWWHRIQMRWTKGSQGTYNLQVRTTCAYKTKPIIYNRITNLWT
jgi:hypothetical protein